MENRNKMGYQQGVVSILVNTLLFVLKYWAGIASGSIALIADAWHTLSDSLSSLIVIVGIKLSSRKADNAHPFGYGRWEQIASIFIGVLLAVIAFDFFRDAIVRFNSQEEAQFGMLAIWVTIISILLKEALAQYAFYVGRKTDNTSIKADAWHHRTDALSSIVVLIGIFLKDYFWWIDSVLALTISLMLFHASYGIISEAIFKILGERPSEKLIVTIKDIIENTIDFNIYPHHFHIHDYVTHRELTFHIRLNRNLDIFTGHQIASKIEHAIKEKLNIESTIHVDPIDKDEHEHEQPTPFCNKKNKG